MLLDESSPATTTTAATLVADGLRYVSDASPGISRRRRGKAFQYFDVNGRRITDPAQLDRIRSIGVPPAYERVWICPHANGHIQATGYDARGRKQYRYHADWRAARDGDKYSHMLDFAAALPHIRRTTDAHMKLPGLPREKVLATVVRLLETTLIRVGNAEYARDNASYGLTTLRRRHVTVSGDTIKFEFMGKSGKKWNLSTRDRRIAAIVRNCSDLPGHELFKYIDEAGTRRDVGSADVNAYLKEITCSHGACYSAKDFRTWAGTVQAGLALAALEPGTTQTQLKKNIADAVKAVSRQLGNTPAICRKCYIHPELLTAYLAGELSLPASVTDAQRRRHDQLRDDEIRVLRFLIKRLKTA